MIRSLLTWRLIIVSMFFKLLDDLEVLVCGFSFLCDRSEIYSSCSMWVVLCGVVLALMMTGGLEGIGRRYLAGLWSHSWGVVI